MQLQYSSHSTLVNPAPVAEQSYMVTMWPLNTGTGNVIKDEGRVNTGFQDGTMMSLFVEERDPIFTQGHVLAEILAPQM